MGFSKTGNFIYLLYCQLHKTLLVQNSNQLQTVPDKDIKTK